MGCDKLRPLTLTRANTLADINSSNNLTDVSSDKLTINDQSSALTVQQCTAHFEKYLTDFTANNDKKLSLLFPHAVSIIKHYQRLPTPLLFINSRYWLSAKEVLTETLSTESTTKYLKSYNQEILFGRFSVEAEGIVNYKQGEVELNNGGVLVLNISSLLVDPSLWFSLKAFMQHGHLQASDVVNAEKIKQLLPNFSNKVIKTKIILVASRFQLDELIQIDPEYTQISSLFCELATQIQASQSSIDSIINYCHNITDELKLQSLDNNALNTLLHFLSIQTQHQQQLLVSPELMTETLMHANLFTDNNVVTSEDLIAYFTEIDEAQSLPRKFSEQSLVEGQIILQLDGEEIGQVNGMSVVELLGYPCEFGEVFRISASDMIGDGEIIDVERKVELAGNIHAKSTLIVQGYLNHFFSHINAFPYSCNLVFEQSYQESDGDSASLAILIAVSSCYAQRPIKQNIFVTGSLDQHGNILAIGGVNQKVEAVTRLFELGLIKAPVTIIIPEANTINLTLNTATLALIESGNINIHAISHCHQAFPILLGTSFDDVLKIINNRIEVAAKEEMGEVSNSLFSRLLNAIFN